MLVEALPDRPQRPQRARWGIAGTGDAGVLQGVLDGQEHSRRRAVVALVDEDRAALEQVASPQEWPIIDYR